MIAVFYVIGTVYREAPVTHVSNVSTLGLNEGLFLRSYALGQGFDNLVVSNGDMMSESESGHGQAEPLVTISQLLRVGEG